jgi:hypothetical protein
LFPGIIVGTQQFQEVRTKVASVIGTYENFCYKRNITDFVLSGKEKNEIVKNIKKVYDAEEPQKRRLPNLNILTYQICNRLDIEIDETLLKIPKSRVFHNRCKKIFQALGWEYIE